VETSVQHANEAVPMLRSEHCWHYFVYSQICSTPKTDRVSGNHEIAKYLVILSSVLWALGANAQNVLDGRVFRDLTAAEAQDWAVFLQETHFKGGAPRLYRRHRVLRIDTDALQSQLHKNWVASMASAGARGVEIPLFNDLTVLLEVDSWVDNDPKMVGVFGTVSGHERPASDFEAYIAEDGKLELSIRLKDVAFLISKVREDEYYLILEFDRDMGPID